MTNRLRELNKFLPYLEAARKEGFDNVVVFTPADLNIVMKKIYGYVYEGGKWIRKMTPYPAISYDIGYYSDPKTVRKVRAIKMSQSIPFVGYGLGSKWKIHQHLSRYPELTPYLIPTSPVTDFASIRSMVDQHGTIIIKPINGKEGKGILRLRRTDKEYCLEENDRPDQQYQEDTAHRIMQRLNSERKYLTQKWIDIRNKDGRVFDIRVLMQKDGNGGWQIAGMAAREGGSGRITSNLMDGGTPFPIEDYLNEQFGKRRATEMKKKLQQLSYQICEKIEESYQKRQAELGLDLAIDRDERIWLIEVNIKPGKIPFRSVFPFRSVEDGVRMPIQYASYLAKQRAKGKKLSFM